MSSPGSVAAVVGARALESLGDHTRATDLVFTGANAMAEAIAAEAEWIWLVDPAAAPEPGALDRLLEGAEPDQAPPAALVAGIVCSASGRPVKDQLPAPQYADGAAIVQLVAHHLLPIRHAQFGNSLIRRSCFDRYGLPDVGGLGPYAAVAWTAEVLRHEPGYFAPLSVVRRDRNAPLGSDERVLASARQILRMTRSGAWTGGESLSAVAGLAARLADPLRR